MTSSTFSSLLSNSHALLFIVGSNSTCNLPASTILLQIEEIIELIRSNHPHLPNSTSIAISTVFPCYKPSLQYPTCSSLLYNIQIYNEGLQTLSIRKQFSIINFLILEEHIYSDGLHVRVERLYILYENIQNHFNTISQTKPTSSHSKRRSKEAIQRRNKRRHEKLTIKQRRLMLTVMRPIARVWQLPHLKAYLKFKQIIFHRLPEIHHQLRIQFHNTSHYHDAETKLSPTDFDEQSYYA